MASKIPRPFFVGPGAFDQAAVLQGALDAGQAGGQDDAARGKLGGVQLGQIGINPGAEKAGSEL